MNNYAKKINTLKPRVGSDFGAVFSESKDTELRERCVKAVTASRTEADRPLHFEEMRELVTYIQDLETALLLHHWGELSIEQVLSRLKSSTGLDIKSQVAELEKMRAEADSSS